MACKKLNEKATHDKINERLGFDAKKKKEEGEGGGGQNHTLKLESLAIAAVRKYSGKTKMSLLYPFLFKLLTTLRKSALFGRKKIEKK